MLITAVRCPRCLLTIYTTVMDYAPRGFTVMSLADEDLLFYNCPMQICEYHVPTFQFVNLYRNPTSGQPMHTSPGFKVAPRTADTSPFRTPAQVAALAFTLTFDDFTFDEQPAAAEPPVIAEQASIGEAVRTPEKQAATEQANMEAAPATGQQPPRQSNGHEVVKQGGTPVAAAADTPKTLPSGTKWTDDEVEKLMALNAKGLAQAKIASEMNRTLLSVRYKLAHIRETEKLAKGQT